MLIEALTESANIVKISYSDYVNDSLLSNNYTIKNYSDVISWKLTNNNISSVDYILMLPETKTLKEIQYDVLGGLENANILVTIQTSIDFSNWYELNYKYDYVTKQYLYKIGDYWFDKDKNEYVEKNTRQKYIFKKLNEYSNEEEYLYSNLEVKFVKISISDIHNVSLSATNDYPIFFNYLKIYIEETFNSDTTYNNLLQIKSDIFTQQKIFEEQTFYPDLITNYLSMLEQDNSSLSDLLITNIDINFKNVSEYLQGIEFDYIEFDLMVY